MKKICLIIPCYNESNRLNFEAFKNEKDIFFIFVNDGSKDETLEKLHQNFDNNSNIFILNLEKNSGKAEAVRQGASFLSTLDIKDEVDWFGFFDADLAIPLCEAKNFVNYQNLFCSDSDAIFGSRIERLGSNISRQKLRCLYSKLFAITVRFITKTKIYDSQCGAKLFKISLIEKIFRESFISTWIFDVEILFRLKNQKIVEYPLLKTDEKSSASHIVFHKIFIKIFCDLIKIYRKYSVK